ALLLRCLQDDLDVRLGHRLPQIPVDDVSATAIENAAQVIERPADIDVRHVNVPVLMSGQRLLEARALLRRLSVPLRQQSRLPQHPPDTGRTHRHNVSVQHHKRQPPIAFQRVLQMEADDRLLLPILQPEIAGKRTGTLSEARYVVRPKGDQDLDDQAFYYATEGSPKSATVFSIQLTRLFRCLPLNPR